VPAPVVIAPAPVAPAQVEAAAPDRPQQSGTGLIIAGSVSLGLAAAMTGTAVAMSARGRRARNAYEDAQTQAEQDRAAAAGKRANVGFFASASLAAGLAVAGIVMTSVGAVRRHRTLAAGPWVSPTTAGVQFRLAF
jgi:hypothetical protein